MNKLVKVLIYLFTLFLIEAPIWNNNEIINYILYGLMFIIDVIIIIKTPKKNIRFDRVDLLLISLPIIYILHTLLGLNVYNLAYNYYYIIPELILVITILVLRRYLKKEHLNIILDGLVYGSIFYFLASLFATDGILSFLGINSLFTDTYVTSIDRMFGTLLYCNSSALLSLVAFLICFYKSKSKEDKYFYKVIMIMNLIAMSYTFSKMVTIIMIMLLFVFIIYSIVRKNYEEIKRLIVEFSSMIIPVFISITALRTYLINNNVGKFIFTILITIIIYILINTLLEYISKKRISIAILLIISIHISSGYLFIKPISIPLKIKNVVKENEYYITDIMFEPDTLNTIEIDYEGEGNVTFHLEGLVEENFVISGVDAGEFKNKKLKFEAKDVEYYLLKIKGINKNTNIKINKILVNGKEYLINSLLVPYSLIHQKELTLYDRESAGNRFRYYNDALNYSKENYFLFGGGKSSFEYKRMTETNRTYLETNPHSYLFELLIDIGILGVFYVFFIYAIGIRNMISKWKHEEYLAIFAIFCGISISLMFDPIMSQSIFKAIYLLSFVLINDLGNNRFKELNKKVKID